jgi:hypothetical protein
MCDSYEDRLFWIRRVEQMRKETERAEELKKQSKTATPGKPAAPEKGVEEHEPIPA